MSAHPHAVAIEATAPEEVAVGTGFLVAIKASCAAGCDLSSAAIELVGPGEATIPFRPAEADGGDQRSAALTASLEPGQHVFRISMPPQEIAGTNHEGATVSLAITVRPHATSLAVWAIPSPVVTGRRFAVKAGARSAAAFDLTGRMIEIRDEAGAVMAKGSLGAEPWPGTEALYWTDARPAGPPTVGHICLVGELRRS